MKVVSDGPIGGMLRFDLPGIGEAVVEAGPPIGDAIFPVRRREGGINTEFAIHNLESSSELVRCELLREGVWPSRHARASAAPAFTLRQVAHPPRCVAE